MALAALTAGAWLAGAGTRPAEQGVPGVAAGQARYPVVIRPGPEAPQVWATLPGADGVPARVACSTCHATRRPDTGNASGAALNEFHQGLRYQHGGLSCLSCHHAGNYDTPIPSNCARSATVRNTATIATARMAA